MKLILKQENELIAILNTSDNFSIVLFSEDINKMNQWMEESKNTNILELNTFISSLETDIEAVHNSISNLDISCKCQHKSLKKCQS